MPIDLRAKMSGGGGVELGQFVDLSKSYPPIVTINGNTYLKNGYATEFNNVDESIWYLSDFQFISTVSGFGSVDINSVTGSNSTWVIVGNSGKASRSTDDGLTWSSIDSKFGSTTISHVHTNGSTWLMVGESGKLSRSTDDGLTWSLVSSGFFSTGINSASECNGVWVIVGSSGKASRSTDDGLTWSSIDSKFGSTDYMTDIVCKNSTWLMVGNSGKASRSTDDGLTWSLVSIGSSVDMSSIAVDNSGVWVMVGSSKSVFRSEDNGLTWSSVDVDDVFNTGFLNGIETDGRVWVIVGNAFSGSGELARSSDGGFTWTLLDSQVGLGMSAKSISTSAGTWVVGGTSGGCARSGGGFILAELAYDTDTKYMRIK